MTLPSSGTLSFSDFNTEVRRGSTTSGNINDDPFRITADKPATQSTISFSDFYSKTYGAATVFAGTSVTGSSIRLYAWKFSQGFSTKYSDPATVPGNQVYNIVTNAKKTIIGANHATSVNRYTAYYPWSDSSGFGTRFSLSGSFPAGSPSSIGDGGGSSFTADGNAIIINGSSASPGAVAFAWTDVSGFGSKFADPGTATPLTSYGMSLSGGFLGQGGGSSENLIFSATSTDANRISAWAFNSSTGWGSKYANPATMPLGSVYSVTSDLFVVIGASSSSSTSERRSVAYNYDFGIGWGSKYTTMSTTLITSTPYSCRLSWIRVGSFSPVVTYSMASSPYIMTIDWTYGSGWGSSYSNPGTLPTGSGDSISFNYNLDVAVGHDISPYLTVYPWTNTGYGTKYADPSTLTGANVFHVIMATQQTL